MTYPNQPYQPQQQFPAMPVPPHGYQVPTPAQMAPAAQQPTPPAPAVPAVRGTLSDFFGQPVGAVGPALKFVDKPVGFTYTGTVMRDITDADIRPQTNQRTGQPEFYRDGRPKLVMVIPLRMNEPSPEFPEGTASWWCRGQGREALMTAMAQAGVPAGTAPEAGAVISITLIEKRQLPGIAIPQNVFSVTYQRPPGAEAKSAPTPDPAPAAQQQAAPAGNAANDPAAGLTPEQAAQLARLTGQAS